MSHTDPEYDLGIADLVAAAHRFTMAACLRVDNHGEWTASHRKHLTAIVVRLAELRALLADMEDVSLD